MYRKNACAHVAVATCNFEFCLQPKNFSLGLAHRSRWRGDGKERADMPTASDVNGGGKRPSDRTASERERPLAALGSFEQPESSCHLLSIRHYVTALGCLPPFPCSVTHSHQGRLALPPASVGSVRIRPSIPSASTPPKKEIVFHTIRSKWDSKCTGHPFMACTWLRECCRHVEAEVVSNSRNKLHQTTYHS